MSSLKGQEEGGGSRFDSLNSLLVSAEHAFQESWKRGGDTENNVRAWDVAHDIGKGILTVLENELEKATDSDDFKIFAAIAMLARRVANFLTAMRIRAEVEAGRLLNELADMGISNEVAVEMINMPKERLDAICNARIEELKAAGAR